jgi:carboxymethylenebutenolidase
MTREGCLAHEEVSVQTDDGNCTVQVLTPAGDGPWPAAIVYMDAGGIRPGMVQVAQRLAAAGYLTLLPDLFYRYGPYGPFEPAEVMKDFRRILGPLMATIDTNKAATDTGALLDYLCTRSDFARGKVGVVGFCMGGGLAVAAAGTHPDRIGAAASFHGGNLATDQPTSPHRFLSGVAAEVYVAAADHDNSYPPEMAARFEAALADADIRYRAETYAGAAHGWMMPDFPVFNAEAAEKGWAALLALFDRQLRHQPDRKAAQPFG